ncbi:probable aconitase/homoaconitase (aconitase superfamily) [Phialocephala subalpina]|uniref:Aconitate hydratase, mitochondrial n=1 Tax=Phialocephala subalpina TaxID=576137 RepID=A0A1L7WHT9_9HELO|nr:probable aconitase/homoaconitase (aconitase superfamily) [Phialocephala subalpina]
MYSTRFSNVRNASGIVKCFQRSLRCPGSVRTLATTSQISPVSKIPLSRYDQKTFIDYAVLDRNLSIIRSRLDRPLTYAEKVLYSHIDNPEEVDIRRGSSYVKVRPARVACQDATGSMALIQFMSAGIDTVAVPTSVHCDHQIVAKDGREEDIRMSNEVNGEVYDFMRSACARYGIGFWKPGAGIIHQTVLENYAFPGGLMIGTDSHTPNAGGLGMAAIGVGGADAVDVMAGLAWEIKAPKIIGVHLTGSLSGWASPKDVILKLAGELTVKGGTGSIIEYFGPGVKSLSCTGMATISNMGAETGATTSVFPYTNQMGSYLDATGRSHIRQASESRADSLVADPGAEYDRVINIDLSSLEPFVNGPSTPDRATPNSKFKALVEQNPWPRELSAALIGSCTNSSFQDMSRAANLTRQALGAGLKPKAPLLLSPGSEQTRLTLEEAGVLETFGEAGATVLANACGPCCGSWNRTDVTNGTSNSVVSSYNRNFVGRLDANPATSIFLTSPEMVMVKAFAGRIDFDPTTDSITTPDGKEFKFEPPTSDILPENGFQNADYVYTPPPSARSDVSVDINPASTRLQRLSPFAPWNCEDFINMPILIKVEGKCTTDHITPSGKWFAWRGHLENISNNTLIGATNAFNQSINSVKNAFTNTYSTVPDTAREYKARNQDWVIITDWNYGEGSSREHAALQPRYLNGKAIIAKSFARIHESNLKKQGMLALTFADEADYDRIEEDDRISLVGLKDLAPGRQVTMVVKKENGDEWRVGLNHTFNGEQIEYFKAGSALNLMALMKKVGSGAEVAA